MTTAEENGLLTEVIEVVTEVATGATTEMIAVAAVEEVTDDGTTIAAKVVHMRAVAARGLLVEATTESLHR